MKCYCNALCRSFSGNLLTWACMYSLPLLPSILYITNLGLSAIFLPKYIWVSLQTTTYISKITKYFDILLLLTCEEVFHAPIVQN